MKRTFIYAMMSAIALAGAVGFTSCAEHEDVAEVNPGYNPETGEVPVKFTFNISTGNTSTTRMSEANVQATSANDFRGMDQTALLSFKQGSANDGKHVASAGPADKLYGLGSILGAGAIGPNSETKSRRILELTLPVGTNALMFWGKATKNETDDAHGKVEATLSQNLSETSFKLCKRVPDGTDATAGFNKAALANYKLLLAKILNTIVQTKYSGTSTYTPSSGIAQTREVTDLAWAAYGTEETDGVTKLKIKTTSADKDPSDDTNAAALCALGETLSKEFVVFNKIYDNEMRAGSGPAVKDMLSSLYSVINSVAEATPTNIEEAVAKNLAIQIRTNMYKALNSSGTGFLGINTIMNGDHLNYSLAMPTGNDDLSQFPKIFGIPEGGTILEYVVATNTYSYKAELPTYDMGGGSSTFNIDNYVYPPELCYFGNSPVRVSDSDADNIFPEGSTDWDTESSWSAWSTDQSVKSSTNSVAMKYNINYGTALLKTQVKYGAAELQDNKHNIVMEREDENTTETNQIIRSDGSASPFALTGILIGGQNLEVGWDYLTKGTGSFSAYVYDRDLSTAQQVIPIYDTSAPSTASNPVYTLVWDNYDSNPTGGKQHPIYIGLEFKNNSGKAFWGQNNLIPVNGTFYITGVLDPYQIPTGFKKPGTSDAPTQDEYNANEDWGISWPDNYALPPYYTAADETANPAHTEGSTIKKRRVFIQDYMTSATFVIGPTSLQKALVSVPDLRSAHLSVGLSVDLNWSTGLSFDNVVLGDTGN